MTLTTAVVLAGGEGSRLQPLTANRPKPLLPAGGRPILEHVLDGLIANGIDEIHLVIGYRGDRVRNRFGPTYRNVDLVYHRQAKQLGSGHALLQVAGAVTEPFIVVNGDQLVEPGLVGDVAGAHRNAESMATLGVVRSEAATRYGAVELDGDDEVVDLNERPGDGDYELLNAGVYAFEAEFLETLADSPRIDGSLALPTVVARIAETPEASVQGVRTKGFWTDATYPWDLLDASQQLMSRGWIRIGPNDGERGPAGADDVSADDESGRPGGEPAGRWIADSARIHPTATLRAPVAVDDDAVVGPGVVVGPNTVVGRNATLEANAVVRSSVIDEDTRVGANTTLTNCVTGQQARIGAGVTVSGGTADVRVGTTIHPDRRLGAVIADRAAVGSGATIRPGVLIGPNVTVDDGARIHTNVDAGEVIR